MLVFLKIISYKKFLLYLQNNLRFKMLKRYNVVFNEKEQEGVYAISVVENPAMESMFLALSKQQKPSINIALKETEEAKKENVLLGVALIPDKPVYRNQNGEEFEIVFTKDTIQKAAHNFLKMGYQHNSSVEHETPINGVSIVESWIVKDANNDAANAYGLSKEDIVEGAWIVKMKCDNKEIYDKAISGEIKGFSIDGLFDLEEIKLNTDVKMSEEVRKEFSQLKDFIANLFSSKKEEIKLGEVRMANEDVVIMFEGEMLVVGADVWVMSEDERVALPAGEYELETGMVLVVAEDGIVSELIEPSNEGSEEEEIEMNEAQDFEQMIKSILVKYKEQADVQLKEALKLQADEFEAKLKERDEKIVELSKTPASKPLKSAPSQSYGKEETITQFLNKRKA